MATEIITGVEAALSRVTVATALDPPTTLAGFKLKENKAAGAGGLTVNVADLVTPA